MPSHKLMSKAGFSLHTLNFFKNPAMEHHLFNPQTMPIFFFVFLLSEQFYDFHISNLCSFVSLIEEWGGKIRISIKKIIPFEIESRVTLREPKIRYQLAVTSFSSQKSVMRIDNAVCCYGKQWNKHRDSKIVRFKRTVRVHFLYINFQTQFNAS